MGIINILDSEISNKIAAGEVVERPSSVVKELVENSIDAGAKKIKVEIKDGGVTYIRVSDDGCGMSAEDAKVCFLRHATSKIQSAADLDAIYTLGFRGEALSSIGAVARVTLRTKKRDMTTGIQVVCEGGEILSSDAAGIPDGTFIEVANLFYNTPARLKFLKRDATEAGYISDIITRFILAHPEISFRFTVNGKEKIFSSGDNSLLNAVYTVYGRDYAKHMREVSYEYEGIRVTGLAGTGSVSRPNRNYQSFFVNSRYIKSPLIIRAVEEAYKNSVMIGKFPMAVLNLSINAELVDINVHPTKLEVKFSNEKDIYHAVYYAVKNVLFAEANVPKIETEKAFKRDTAREQLYLSDMVKELPKKDLTKKEYPRDKRSLGDIYRSAAEKGGRERSNPFLEKESSKDSSDKRLPERGGYEDSAVNAYVPKMSRAAVQSPKEDDDLFADMIIGKRTEKTDAAVFSEKAGKTADIKADEEQTAERTENEEKPKISGEPKMPEIPEVSGETGDAANVSDKPEFSENENEDGNIFVDEYFEIVGQIFNTYIIAQKGDEMLIMDQHAAHERLKYEELKRDIENKEPFSQLLIEPVIITLTGSEYEAFSQIRDTLNGMGFDCDDFGDNTVSVRAVPGDVDLGEVEDLVLELIGAYYKKEVITERNQRLLYTIACKSAIKANHRLSLEEMRELMRNVLRLKNINTCPHGRPIIITMSKKELEKEFGRIV